MKERVKRKVFVRKKSRRKHRSTRHSDRDTRYLTHVKILWGVVVLISVGLLLALYLIVVR